MGIQILVIGYSQNDLTSFEAVRMFLKPLQDMVGPVGRMIKLGSMK